MISIFADILLFAAILFVIALLKREVKQAEGKAECILEHLSNRISAIYKDVEKLKNTDSLEERKAEEEAERRFTQGVNAILNYDFTAAFGKRDEK